jgi:nucleotide-binding universal stress UspA family protein
MKKIIAAVDFSEVSEAVIEQSTGLAQAFSAELTLIHVAAPDPEFVGYNAGPDTVRQQRARELTKEHQTLQETAERLRQQGRDDSEGNRAHESGCRRRRVPWSRRLASRAAR